MPQRYRPRARVPRAACCGAGFHNINALSARRRTLKMAAPPNH
ncbi:hypothetical protein [Ralstonia pseudosolanacearum]|nr:hypothetical protein [Ralstonia pseudosolanacearum]